MEINIYIKRMTMVTSGISNLKILQIQLKMTDPNFSPINNKIIFSYFLKTTIMIFIMNPDGSGRENLTNTDSYEKFPQFSPDGSFIIKVGKMENGIFLHNY